MPKFMVKIRSKGDPVGLGLKDFEVAPCIDDIIGLTDDKGVGQAYKVASRLFPIDPQQFAGDLELVHIGNLTDYLSSLGK